MKLLRTQHIAGSFVSNDQEKLVVDRSYGGQSGIVPGFGGECAVSFKQISVDTVVIHVARGLVILAGREVEVNEQDITRTWSTGSGSSNYHIRIDLSTQTASIVTSGDSVTTETTIPLFTLIKSSDGVFTVTSRRSYQANPILSKSEIIHRLGYTTEGA